MKKIVLLLALVLTFPVLAQVPPKFEVRAAWLTTAYALDWPRTRATTAAGIRKQKDELVDILDKLKAANFNTVLFQARTRGELLYPSVYEPFSSVLTGKINGDPDYDPLAFVIEESHKRGMECHAWIVAIPLGNRSHVRSLGYKSVLKSHPELCLAYKNEYFMNPGHPDTKVYLMKLVNELIKNYDVDGVHFDYLRYPERAVAFPDRADFRKYAKGRSLDQWRRDNISEIVRYIYKGVKAVKPWVKVSTSPVGKYRDTSRYSSNGWNSFYTVYQDVQGWLGEGIQDQIYPMLYFRGNNFYPFALDWQEQSNQRQIVPGLGIYFLDPKEGNWHPDEIERQIRFIRNRHLAGEGHYRMQYLMENTQGIYQTLADYYYTAPALIPPMPWLDRTVPSSPSNLRVENDADGYVRLSWTASTDNDARNPPRYVVYGSTHYPVDTTNPQNMVAIYLKESQYTYVPILPWQAKTYFAVSAIDRYGNESQAIQQKR